MEAEYTYYFTKDAAMDIESINSYISDFLLNPTAAKRFNSELKRLLILTCSNPFMWSKVQNEGSPDKTIRKIPLKNYLIFYRPVEETREIQVIRVIPGMMDYQDIL